jgi:hypothetical protein
MGANFVLPLQHLRALTCTPQGIRARKGVALRSGAITWHLNGGDPFVANKASFGAYQGQIQPNVL